ncbi:MAG TPA: hypothetical protein VJL84_00570, partial [Kiloniellales bacterium]|nr:hypothetical protein [Kiloniellales bacterium]
VKADPFWPTGLRKGVRILAWKQVFGEGKRCHLLGAAHSTPLPLTLPRLKAGVDLSPPRER